MTVTLPFGPATTANEVLAGVRLDGRRVVVTGGASGIGEETARTLARAGAEVTIAVRDVSRGSRIADAIVTELPGTEVFVAHLDLLDQESVARFADEWSGPLHVLVNNAGVMALPERALTEEGWEAQLAANHLGHAALALRMHDALAEAEDARVVSVASSGHLRSPMHFDDLHFEHREYDPIAAYAQSKTATILFAVAAAERWANDGIAVNALHPGIIRTPLQRYQDPADLAAIGANDDHGNPIDVPAGWKSRQQGASTTVLLAASPLIQGVTGRYFEDNHEAGISTNPAEDFSGVARHAIDKTEAERLWAVTQDLLHL